VPIPLANLPKNTPAIISAIHASEDILARMMAWGITLNSSIKILRKGPFQGPMQVQLGRINLMMPSTLVATLEVIQS
jgi:Fe2+ transport system protein FeoA